MPSALDLLNNGLMLIGTLFGSTQCILQQPANGPTVCAFTANWNDLGRHEEITLNGKRVFFSVLIEATQAQFAQLPKEGQIVIRSSDGFTGRIVGEVRQDGLTVRFPLDTRNK
jgi:hypothetical protein